MTALATMDRLWDLDAPVPEIETDTQPGSEREPTLDQLITGAWSQLHRHRTVACPVCGDDMAPQYGAHAMPVSGRCTSCHSELT